MRVLVSGLVFTYVCGKLSSGFADVRVKCEFTIIISGDCIHSSCREYVNCNVTFLKCCLFCRPFWLSPTQAIVIPVSPKYEEYAIKVRVFDSFRVVLN